MIVFPFALPVPVRMFALDHRYDTILPHSSSRKSDPRKSLLTPDEGIAKGGLCFVASCYWQKMLWQAGRREWQILPSWNINKNFSAIQAREYEAAPHAMHGVINC
jgi:hypothetical protein